jgi:gamma-aminobutyric acid type B receptor
MFTKKGYHHFFRIVQSENEYNPPRLSLLRYFNWTRVGTLYQNEAKYSLAHNNLILELEKNKFEVVESQSFNDEITNQLEILRDKDTRIILANFNETWAR